MRVLAGQFIEAMADAVLGDRASCRCAGCPQHTARPPPLLPARAAANLRVSQEARALRMARALVGCGKLRYVIKCGRFFAEAGAGLAAMHGGTKE